MTDHFDVVVVGGGIQGAGVAQAAAAEGHSVLLLEKSGLAHGTSSKSSKLIHGGLRYLESGEFSLVRECLTEQAILLKIAPDLVKMRKFYIPVYEQTRRSRLAIGAGLGLYHALAKFRKNSRPSIVRKSKWPELDGLRTEDLKTVFCYADAQTDDRLLTQAVMQSAQKLEAQLLSPARFLHANLHQNGTEVVYLQDGQEHSCTAKVLVNAGGPWVNEIAQKIMPKPESQEVDLVGGTHIILEGRVNQGVYYTESPRDGRAVFVMPWYGKTMVGTTERVFRDMPDLIKPTLAEKNYLLSILRHYFPSHRDTTVNDINEAWAGLRVLPKATGHAFHRSREVIFKTDRKDLPRVVSIYGGKLTAYRATAQDAMSYIRPSLPEATRRGYTDELPLDHPG